MLSVFIRAGVLFTVITYIKQNHETQFTQVINCIAAVSVVNFVLDFTLYKFIGGFVAIPEALLAAAAVKAIIIIPWEMAAKIVVIYTGYLGRILDQSSSVFWFIIKLTKNLDL